MELCLLGWQGSGGGCLPHPGRFHFGHVPKRRTIVPACMRACMRVRYALLVSDKRKDTKRTGPRGGDTTVTAGGLLKKTIYFSPEEWQALRKKSYEEERPVSEIVRQLVVDAFL